MLKTELESFRRVFDRRMTEIIPVDPRPLYDPMHYIFSLPSKKLRPFLVYTFSRGYLRTEEELPEKFWNIAASLEMLHNFTLIHDDIMDEDDWRRGKKTVHKRWDINTAVLGGDGLLALAFQTLTAEEMENFREISREFSRSVLTVCEGQALDKEFESLLSVNEEEYLEMIYKKTGSLIEGSCMIGAYAGEAPKEEYSAIREFGRNLGIAFQLQDDYLDIFAQQEELGKDIGSDLVMRKKTIIMIKILQHPGALEKIDGMLREENLPIEKIRKVLVDSGIAGDTRNLVYEYTSKAKRALDSLSIHGEMRKLLWELAEYLEQRTH
jgi:geranylgeranyl diphosphate synthase type II